MNAAPGRWMWSAVAANTAYGLGRHIRDVNPANLPHYFRVYLESLSSASRGQSLQKVDLLRLYRYVQRHLDVYQVHLSTPILPCLPGQKGPEDRGRCRCLDWMLGAVTTFDCHIQLFSCQQVLGRHSPRNLHS